MEQSKVEAQPIWDRIGDAMREAGIRSVTVFKEGGYSVHTANAGWGTGATLDEALGAALARRLAA